MFECNICCDQLKENTRLKKLICNNCDFIVCSLCQKNYGKLECSSCHIIFTKKFGYDHLGKTFVNNTIKQNEIKTIMHQQRNELETIAPLVEWTKLCNKIKASYTKLEFKIIFKNNENNTVVGLPPKPERKYTSIKYYKCPMDKCVGIIINEECSLCKTNICKDCNTVKHSNHSCDPKVLESIKLLKSTTKPCPNCHCLIEKSEGCDAMHCTYCGTHFSYTNLTVLLNSSNYHYRNRLIQKNISTDLTNECRTTTDNPRIPLDIINNSIIQYKRIINPSVIDILYNTTDKIRYLMTTEYNLLTITGKSRDKYDDYQIKFAMNEITEKQWESLVYKNYVKQKMYELINYNLNLYLIYTDDFQSELYEYIRFDINSDEFQLKIDELIFKIKNFISLINQNILNIYEDNNINTNILHIKNFDDQETILKISTNNKQNKDTVLLPFKSIELYSYQYKHVYNLEHILEKTHFAFDLSPLGTGKTYTAAKIYQNNNNYKHILTISPMSVKNKWINMNQEYGLNSENHLTYNEITGSKFKSPLCGYLIRNDYKAYVEKENGQITLIDKYSYTATEKFKQLVQEGLLLIIDEFQNIKNNSAQTESCAELIREIYSQFLTGNSSRVILMSGSPFDKKIQLIRLMKTINIITEDKIVNGHKYAGINELIDYIKTNHFKLYITHIKNSESTYITKIWANGEYKYYQQAYNCIEFIYNIFINIFKVHFSSIMEIQELPNAVLHKYNGIFIMDNTDNQIESEKALNELQKITKFNGYSIDLRQSRYTMLQITKILMKLEYSKLNIFYRLAMNDLTKTNKKIVIGLNFNESIHKLTEMLIDYKPIVIQGKTSLKNRQKLITTFQEPNLEARLIIANINVISTGIDLDDKYGQFPRVCYASPNYNTINIYQLGHRFLRGLDTKSDTNIYMVYTNHINEQKIIESLMSKSLIMKNTVQTSEQHYTYPCDYITYNE